MQANALTPGSPIPHHDNVRKAFSGEKPIDARDKSTQGGPGTVMDKSRDYAYYITSRLNTITSSMGGKINIFA